MQKAILWGTDFGIVTTNLKDLMDNRGITISEMSRLANLKYDVVKRYYKNEIYQVDLQIIAKFCYVLECSVSDILDYNNAEMIRA